MKNIVFPQVVSLKGITFLASNFAVVNVIFYIHIKIHSALMLSKIDDIIYQCKK